MNATSQTTVVRSFIYRVVIIAVLMVLSVQLWRLQIRQGADLRAQADSNRFREIIEPAARGVIYDDQGRILARNRPTFSLAVVPADLPDDDDQMAAELDRLLTLLTTPIQAVITPTATVTPTAVSPAVSLKPTAVKAKSGSQVTPTATPLPATPLPPRLPLTGEELHRLPRDTILQLITKAVIDARLGSAFRPVVVATQISQDVAFVLQEESYALPGVQVQISAFREYLTGALTADVIGYMGPIPADKADVYKERGYGPNDWVGYAGIERSFESELRGQSGYRAIQVDVAGREVNTVGQPRPPVPGNNLVLTVDIDLQQAMEAALRRGMAASHAPSGAAVALNPQNGAVLGMVSLPTYDNNIFADGITEQEYAKFSENKQRPLLNNAISGIYPPGSTFKLVTASAGLETGVINARTRLNDNGILWLPNKYYPNDPTKAQPFYCWISKYGRGHGSITVLDALAESCDVFFYQVAGGYLDFQGLNVDREAEYARYFGYGEATNIDLPGEHPGLIPTDQWKRLTYGEGWVTGDTYNMAIGQGFVLATPLQVANATAVIANRGTLYRPQLVARVTDDAGNVVRELVPDVIRQIPVAPEYIEVVREGLYGAINWPQGTAPGARVAGIQVAGKTGTAEFWDPDIGYDAKGNLPTHAWFTAFAPFDNPQIALVVFLYNGGEGSAAAVPVASEILHYFFKVPMPPGDPYQRIRIGD